MTHATNHRLQASSTAATVTATLHHLALSDITRLHLVSLLATDQWRRFAYLRETLELTDDRLKRHFYLLISCGHVETIRGVGGTGWARLTALGADQRDQQFVALQQLLTLAWHHASATQATRPEWFAPVIAP